MYNEERENERMERKDEVEEGVVQPTIGRFIARRYTKFGVRVQIV